MANDRPDLGPRIPAGTSAQGNLGDSWEPSGVSGNLGGGWTPGSIAGNLGAPIEPSGGTPVSAGGGDPLSTAALTGLTISDGSNTYSVRTCRINYAVNQFSAATVVLALGYDVDDKVLARFQSAADASAIWSINSTGTLAALLFQGRLHSVARQANRAPTGSAYSIQLQLMGLPQALSRMAVAGFAFWNKAHRGALAAGANVVQLQTTQALSQQLRQDKSVVDASASIGMRMVKVLDKMYALITADTRSDRPTLSEYYIDNPSFTLQPAVNPATGEGPAGDEQLVTAAIDMMQQHLVKSDLWSALQQVTQNALLLQTIPRVQGFSLAPAFYWSNTAVATLSADDVINITGNIVADSARDDFDAVFVERHSLSPTVPARLVPAGFIAWPQLPGYATARALVTSMPAWMQKTLTRSYNVNDIVLKPEDGVGSSSRVAAPEQSGQADPAEADDFGKRYAAMVYASAKGANNGKSIEVPWYRFDLLKYLGYVIKVEGLVDANTGVADGALYGAMVGLTIDAGIGATNGAIRMRIDLSNVRSEEENGQLGLSEHPLYAIDSSNSFGSSSANPTEESAKKTSGTKRIGPYSPSFASEDRAGGGTGRSNSTIVNDQSRRAAPPGYYGGRHQPTPRPGTGPNW